MEKQEMTKERLESYRKDRDAQKMWQYKLDHLGEEDSLIGNDVIFDYRTGYPRPQTVVGEDRKKKERLRKQYQKKIDELEQKCIETEDWILTIPDSQVGQMCWMQYVDGKTQRKVAKKVHTAQSTVSKKISKYLKME